jgi:U3 small nucleolar RNA-associated protein 15
VFTQLAVTGSYDHTVRVWNVENPLETMEETRCLAVLNHGAPVEELCLLKSEDPNIPMWLLSAGGTTIKVWNPLSGQCFHTVATFHRKTITSLLPVLRSNFEEDNLKVKRISMRILSAGLDGLIQFHSWDAKTGSMRHLYSTKLNESITSVATDTSGDRFAFGTVSGEVVFRMKGPSVVHKKRLSDPRAGTYSFFQRGMNAVPTAGDYTVTSSSQKRRKLNRWDFAMKKFRYAEALDEVLQTKHPRVIMGVLEELGKRRALTHALSNRDEESLEPLLSFVIRNIRRPHFTGVLIGVAHKLIDIYGIIAGESDVVDELFKKLKHQIALECRDQKALMLLVGQIEFFSVPSSSS